MPASLIHPPLFSRLQGYVNSLLQEFEQIPSERRALLHHLTFCIQGKVKRQESVLLTFICTHNSRRSHLSQIWAQTAAYYYGIPQVQTYSGGTEATAFNPRAVIAIKNAGFRVEQATGQIEHQQNLRYLVSYSAQQPPMEAFSKVYNRDGNPLTHFAAVMTCTHADEHCPFIAGATRISLPFDDPKAFDNTPQEELVYGARTRQIGREILYAFSQVNQ